MYDMTSWSILEMNKLANEILCGHVIDYHG
jgi:hypothetical protein